MIPAPAGGVTGRRRAGDPARLDDLKVGPLLAEGGEGRVYLLPRQPHLLYKEYRRPVTGDHLDAVTAWPSGLDPEAAARVSAGAAWPAAVVTGPDDRPTGLLVPRAPRRFSLRHRDGHSRLASLSYLTADPGHRAAAYGLDLPAPAGPARIGLAYALARLLDAFQSAPQPVGHGDLSTKNVLWSLQRGPEVFVIDCDNAEVFGPGGLPAGDGRRRAMTPNWDDPAVARGANPTLASDRYSLALIFLRVVGAANFPIQARQRGGGPVRVEFPVPAGPAQGLLLDPDAPVWDLAARSLGVSDPGSRPPAAAWVAVLERLLDDMGAADVAAAVRAGQGGGPVAAGPAASVAAGPAAPVEPAERDREVAVRPVPAAERPSPAWSKVRPTPRYTGAPSPLAGAPRGGAAATGSMAAATGSGPAPGGFAWRPVTYPGSAGGGGAAAGAGTASAGATTAPAGGAGVVTGVAVWPEVRTLLLRLVRWWASLHASMVRSLATPGRRRAGLRSLAFCILVDLVFAVVVGIFGAMVVAPVVGV